MKRLSLLLLALWTADPLWAGDLVRNGTFQADAQRAIPDWVKIRNPTPGVDLPAGITATPVKALHIQDAGGLTQTVKGLRETQAYRLTFRAWRRGGDWAPKPSLFIGGVPLPISCETLPPSAASQPGKNLERYSLDQPIRPGAGDFELKIEVFGDIIGLSNYTELWVEQVTLTPVEGEVPLLDYPVEATAFRDRALLRAGRPETIGLQLTNPCDALLSLKVKLIVPNGVRVLDPVEREVSTWTRRDIYAPFIRAYGVPRKVPEKVPSATLTWQVEAEHPGDQTFQIEVAGQRTAPLTVKLDATFEPALQNAVKGGAIPPPVKADTGDIKVGAMFYPGWVPGTGWGWSLLDPYPNRKPALGYYDDTDVEVMDWQIKWALEHGVSFFNFCWYRDAGNEGKPVVPWLNETLERGLLKSTFLDRFEFAITWENHNRGGISSKEDLLDHLLPYWIEHYFSHPRYLTFDGNPVLFIYSMDVFVAQLGGIENARTALEAMRQQCRTAGLKGLIVAGECRSDNQAVFARFQQMGLDASWSYGMEKTDGLLLRREWGMLPDIPTITMGWDPRPWQDYIGYWWTSHWQRTPAAFGRAAAETHQVMKSWPEGSIARHIVQLDNWNEWGEGHYIAPSREHGFSYLEAIRQTFAPNSPKPVNLLPDDVGKGPYEQPHNRWLEGQKQILNIKAETEQPK